MKVEALLITNISQTYRRGYDSLTKGDICMATIYLVISRGDKVTGIYLHKTVTKNGSYLHQAELKPIEIHQTSPARS